jgi:hypothetical protein
LSISFTPAHLWDLVRKLHPHDEASQKAWMKVHQKRLLDKGKIEKLVDALRAIPSANPEVAEKIRIEAGCLERNAERMRYPKFRRQHLFVGSGVIEAGCKSVIGSRLKPSGMRHARKRVLDRARSKRHPGPALLPSQRPVRDLLGGAPDCLIVTSMSHTRREGCAPVRGSVMKRI